MNSDMVLSLVIPNLKVVMHQSIEATIEKVKNKTQTIPLRYQSNFIQIEAHLYAYMVSKIGI